MLSAGAVGLCIYKVRYVASPWKYREFSQSVVLVPSVSVCLSAISNLAWLPVASGILWLVNCPLVNWRKLAHLIGVVKHSGTLHYQDWGSERIPKCTVALSEVPSISPQTASVAPHYCLQSSISKCFSTYILTKSWKAVLTVTLLFLGICQVTAFFFKGLKPHNPIWLCISKWVDPYLLAGPAGSVAKRMTECCAPCTQWTWS